MSPSNFRVSGQMDQFQGKIVSHCIRWKAPFRGNVEVEYLERGTD